MAEMKLTKKGQNRISQLVTALGQDESLRERFQTDPRGVLSEFGLGRLIPAGADLDVTVDAESPDATARLSAGAASPTHLDLAHIDQSNPFPDPLPPTHFDWAHTDAVLLTGTKRPTSVLKIRGVAERGSAQPG